MGQWFSELLRGKAVDASEHLLAGGGHAPSVGPHHAPPAPSAHEPMPEDEREGLKKIDDYLDVQTIGVDDVYKFWLSDQFKFNIRRNFSDDIRFFKDADAQARKIRSMYVGLMSLVFFGFLVGAVIAIMSSLTVIKSSSPTLSNGGTVGEPSQNTGTSSLRMTGEKVELVYEANKRDLVRVMGFEATSDVRGRTQLTLPSLTEFPFFLVISALAGIFLIRLAIIPLRYEMNNVLQKFMLRIGNYYQSVLHKISHCGHNVGRQSDSWREAESSANWTRIQLLHIMRLQALDRYASIVTGDMRRWVDFSRMFFLIAALVVAAVSPFFLGVPADGLDQHAMIAFGQLFVLSFVAFCIFRIVEPPARFWTSASKSIESISLARQPFDEMGECTRGMVVRARTQERRP